MATPGIPPNITVPGVVGSIPSGYLLGRVSPGTGPVQLIRFSDIGSGGSGTGKPAGGGGGSTGTVTSVALTAPGIFNVGGSPVTTTGTLALSLATQIKNKVFAGPTTGADAAPTFRALVAADIPAISLTTGVSGTLPIANGGTGQITAGAAFNALSPITTTGDLIIGTGANAAGRLAIGANKTVLASNGTTAAWTTLSAGGLVPGTFLSQPGAPSVPVAANFTMLTNGLATTITDLASGRGVAIVTPTGTTTSQWMAKSNFVVPAAGTDFTAKCLVYWYGISPSQAAWLGIGAIDTNNKIAMFGQRMTGAGIEKLVLTTIGGAQAATTLIAGTNTPSGIITHTPTWYRLQRVGTNFVFSYSLDGETWLTVSTASATTDLVATLSAVGPVFAMNGTDTQSIQRICTMFDFTTSTP